MSKGGAKGVKGSKGTKGISILGFRVPTTCGGKGKGRIKGEQREQRGAKGANMGQRGLNREHFYTRFLGSPPPVGLGE